MGQKEIIKNERIRKETSRVQIELERSQKEHRRKKNKRKKLPTECVCLFPLMPSERKVSVHANAVDFPFEPCEAWSLVPWAIIGNF